MPSSSEKNSSPTFSNEVSGLFCFANALQFLDCFRLDFENKCIVHSVTWHFYCWMLHKFRSHGRGIKFKQKSWQWNFQTASVWNISTFYFLSGCKTQRLGRDRCGEAEKQGQKTIGWTPSLAKSLLHTGLPFLLDFYRHKLKHFFPHV